MVDQKNTIDHQLFQMSDLGALSYYLGIEVKQEADRIMVSQSSYARKILQAAGMESCNGCHVPMENRLKIGKLVEGEVIDANRYRSLVGSLRYLVNTRPDLTYSVGIVSRYMEAPGKQHWAALKQILRYVQETVGLGCVFRRGAGPEVITGFSDSDLTWTIGKAQPDMSSSSDQVQ